MSVAVGAASWALQQALMAVLSADSVMQKLTGNPPRIYDAVPRAAVFPYLVLAEDCERAWPGGAGSEHSITLHVFSRAGGRREVKLIAAAAVAALAGTALQPQGFHLVNWQFTQAQYGRSSDGRTWRAILSFRAVTESEN